MHFPKYWAKSHWSGEVSGQHVERDSWGWSDTSEEDAKRRGVELARRAASADWSKKKDLYLYTDRPLREEVLTTLEGAIISRNSYGAEILNCDSLVFVDVDLPTQPTSSGGFLSGIFGKKRAAVASPEQEKLEKLRHWQRLNGRYSFRVYRTAGGLRYLLINSTLDPSARKSLFDSTDCDPRYAKLCDIQKSFRARLTPKPWRMGLPSPKYRFPYSNDEQRSAAERWVGEYDNAATQFATCKYLETIGDGKTATEFVELVSQHDLKTSAERDLPLA